MQVCGHQTSQHNGGPCHPEEGMLSSTILDQMVCGSYVCQTYLDTVEARYTVNTDAYMDDPLNQQYLCLSRNECKNIEIKKEIAVCSYQPTCYVSWGGMIITYKEGNNILGNRSQHHCDSKCDCGHCEDEYDCGKKNTNGVICKHFPGGMDYFVSPYQICDGINDCYSGLDERNCTREKSPSLRTCKLHGHIAIRDGIRVLNDQNSCAVIDGKVGAKAVDLWGQSTVVCDDYKDQMNCTDDTIKCKVQVSL